ncbi:MAG: endonuclease/exonuclease/phosphatase family protein [Candidatus Sungbacteria bacterium]|nr:endonuclease/exonuclease/phosphatase family protein [Parcubacteria group bacterium]MBI2639378.1 endonuclease/exonuclease/phosphatase family protein [Candidatus Sungbacteria bacterium]
MKLISLNIWGGRSLYPLLEFFKKKGPDLDIFCLQEVHHADQKGLDERHPEEHVRGDIFLKIGAVLKDFEGFFAHFDDNPYRSSLAFFIKRTAPIKIKEVGDFLVYEPKQVNERGSRVFSARKLQYAKILDQERGCTIMNFHGLWNAGPKTDTEDRIAQSVTIRNFFEKTAGTKILCGDFNLLPETQSMKIIEAGMRNLIKEHAVQSTRTVLYRHYDNPDEPNFADYILVTPDVIVRRFEVLPDIVSDHSPLYLEYEVSGVV